MSIKLNFAPNVKWGLEDNKLFETGVDCGVVYWNNITRPWDGLVSVDDVISGGEFKPYYYDGKRLYTDVTNIETELKISSFTYPKDFDTRFGYQPMPDIPGFLATNQTPGTFDMTYRTLIGNSTDGVDFAYRIHLLYNCVCLRSDRTYETVNADPELDTFEFSVNTTPDMSISGMESGHYILDSRYVSTPVLNKFLKQLYGSGTVRGRMLPANQMYYIIKTALSSGFGFGPYGYTKFGES
jgi:hypothetical protein